MIQKRLQYLALLLCGVLVIVAYIWFTSTGLWTTLPATTNYYDQLAKSFQEGHLYLDVQPDPALLQLSDPYDPDLRQSVPALATDKLESIWDMALYHGRIYLYWGPAPALFLAGIKMFYRGEIGDQALIAIFISGLFIFQSLILLRVWRRFFEDLPFAFVLSGILLLAFINPIPWMLGIPRIYEAAIAADQFFFVGGLYFVFAALDRPVYSVWRFALAGIFWVFAVGSRATMAIPIIFLGLMLIAILFREGPKPAAIPNLVKNMAGLGVPLLAGAIGLGWYNQARFGSIFEFGFRYEITMLNQNKLQNVLFSPIYMIPNLYLYIFNPPNLARIFPFISPIWNGEFISSFNSHYHTIFNAERILGLMYAFPFSIFAVIAVAKLLADNFNKPAHEQPDPEKRIRNGRNDLLGWLLIGLAGSLVLELLTILTVFYGTMRYFMDVTPTLSLLSIFGFWQGYLALRKNTGWSILFAAVGIALIAVSVLIGILLAFSSDVPRIRANNPALLAYLRLFFAHLIKYVGK